MANMEKQMNEAGQKFNGAARDAKASISHGVQQGMEKAREGAKEARGTVDEVRDFIANEAPDYLKQALSDMRDSAARATEASKSTINKYPFYAVAGAVVAGTALGLFLGRSKK